MCVREEESEETTMDLKRLAKVTLYIYETQQVGVSPLVVRMKRKRVSSNTVDRIGTDVWVIICAQMHRSPHVVFRLMSASKTVYNEIGHNDAWWNMFFTKVCYINRGGSMTT